MKTEEFMDAARTAFAEATREDVGLTVKADYVEHVREVGVVGCVAAYRTDPWQHAFGEVLLLEPGGSAEAALDRLGAKLGALSNLEVELEGSINDVLELPAPGEFTGVASTEDIARRQAALDDAVGRFDAVAAKMREVYGYPLPRHIVCWHALVQSLSPIEARGLDALGRRPGGIMIWFEDGGLEREPRDGLDPRLDCRFRCDPPELVTTMWGDSDGLHLGLWYDHPDEMPSFLAGNWARDSAETSRYEQTHMRTLRKTIRERAEWGDEEMPFTMGALDSAIEWFMEPELGFMREEGVPAWAASYHPQLLGGLGSGLRREHGDPRGAYPEVQHRYEAYKEGSSSVDDWIVEAREELGRGEPAFLLALGRELWWLDSDDYRDLATELLVEGYQALGRDKLAELVQLHHEHRDLQSVAVY